MKHAIENLARPLAALLLSLCLTGAAYAAEGYDDAKMDAYVNAAIAVDSVVNEWSPKIGAAKNEAEAQSMKEKANAELSAAIESTMGITVAEYTQILDAA